MSLYANIGSREELRSFLHNACVTNGAKNVFSLSSPKQRGQIASR